MTSNKILPVALVAALLGGTVGAFVMRPSKSTPDTAQATTQSFKANEIADKSFATDENELVESELADEMKGMSDVEKAAYRDGFMLGVEAARDTELTASRASAVPAASRVSYRNTPRSVNYRNTPRTRSVNRSAPRRVYYDYGQKKGRSFWQKHRDKLTVAMGAGGGAVLGGVIGGKKGAAIGALAGGGGSALYTYKIRKRNRNR
ncbi:MAG: hypothetical protein H7Z38_05045 [Rubrivivax sp.]|nr:hypothetical protein [Pyrinomonadaceae bacterium]